MNFEEQIYYSCAAWASIHPNRASALDHMFCVNGNGYEWVNGELLEMCGDTTAKNGRRLSVKAAINKVFRERREHDKAMKKWEAKLRREKRKNPPPPDPVFEAKLDDMITKALEENRKAKEADPAAFEARAKKSKADLAAIKKRIRDDRRHDYRIPSDIDKRVKDTAFNNWYPMSPGYARLLDFPEDIKPDWLDGIIETCNLIIAQPRAIREGFNSLYSAKESEKTTAIAKQALNRALKLKKKQQNEKRKRAHERI